MMTGQQHQLRSHKWDLPPLLVQLLLRSLTRREFSSDSHSPSINRQLLIQGLGTRSMLSKLTQSLTVSGIVVHLLLLLGLGKRSTTVMKKSTSSHSILWIPPFNSGQCCRQNPSIHVITYYYHHQSQTITSIKVDPMQFLVNPTI